MTTIKSKLMLPTVLTYLMGPVTFIGIVAYNRITRIIPSSPPDLMLFVLLLLPSLCGLFVFCIAAIHVNPRRAPIAFWLLPFYYVSLALGFLNPEAVMKPLGSLFHISDRELAAYALTTALLIAMLGLSILALEIMIAYWRKRLVK